MVSAQCKLVARHLQLNLGLEAATDQKSHTFIVNASTQMSRQEPRPQRHTAVALSSRVSVPMRAARPSLAFSGTLAWMRAGRILPITQYFDTTSRSFGDRVVDAGRMGYYRPSKPWYFPSSKTSETL